MCQTRRPKYNIIVWLFVCLLQQQNTFTNSSRQSKILPKKSVQIAGKCTDELLVSFCLFKSLWRESGEVLLWTIIVTSEDFPIIIGQLENSTRTCKLAESCYASLLLSKPFKRTAGSVNCLRLEVIVFALFDRIEEELGASAKYAGGSLLAGKK